MIKSILYWSFILTIIIINIDNQSLVSSLSLYDNTNEWRGRIITHDTYSSPHQYSRYHRFENNDLENEIEFIGSSTSESNRRSPGNTTTKKGKILFHIDFQEKL